MTAKFDFFEQGSGGTLITNTQNAAACFYNSGTAAYAIAVGDIDGDGFTDVVLDIPYYIYNSHLNRWRTVQSAAVLKNNESGALIQANADNSLAWPFIFAPPDFPSDFNGDGRVDGFGSLAGTVYGYDSNGDGTFTQDGGHSVPSTATTFLTGDFDGDGCTDILAQGGGTGQIAYFCQPAVTSVTVPDWTPAQTVIGDFNGDGKSDVLVLTNTGATLYLSTGTGFAPGIAIPGSSTWHQYTAVVGDWNGDGKSDLLLLGIGYTANIVLLSTGTGFEQLTTIPNSVSTLTAVAADLNSDGAQDFIITNSNTGSATQYLFSYTPELMTSVSNGVGATTTVTYDRINKNGTLYTKCPSSPTSYACGTAYPTQAVDAPLYVVSTSTTSNGIGGTDSWTYAYGGLARDLHGRGFLGFSQQKVTNSQTGIVTTTNFRTDFPYIGLVSSQTVVSGSVTLKSVTNTWQSTNEGGSGAGAAYYLVTLEQGVASGADLDGSTLPTTTTSFTYDAYGNALTRTASVSDGSSSTMTNTYNNDTTDWFIGQLLTTQTENIVGSSNLTRHLSASYSATNKPNQLVLEPGNSALSVTAGIGFDSFDNANSQSFSGAGITTRSSGVTFDSKGQFATTATNALSQSSTLAYNPNFGETTSVTDPNSLTATTGYDTFGRTTSTVAPDGNKTVASYAYCSGVNGGTASCLTYGAWLVQSTPETSGGTQNGPQTTTYHDVLGRVIETTTQGFDGSTIAVATQYDLQGRVAQTSRPYFVSGGTAKWTVYSYDVLARVTLATFPDTSTKSFAYHGLTRSVTNANSQTTTTVLNAQGLVASRTDANSKTTSYVYDAFGNPLTVTDPSGHAISNTFDLRGRKTATSDPDMGSWSYVYDVLSELTSQTDAKSQTTTLSYDLLSRVTQRVEPSLTSNWVYDTATDGIGAISSACTGSGCTSPSTASYFRAHAYDLYGRPSSVALSIAGGANNTYAITYDANGRVATVTYPSGFVAKYVYTSLGYLSEIVDNTTSAVYWTANTRDAELHLTQATAGNGVITNQSFDANTGRLLGICATPDSGACDGATANFGYTWDAIGNLLTRADTDEQVSEKYCYDVLNRLTNSATGTSGATVSSCTASGTNIIDKTIGYDALGDITSKSDVGTYAYGSGAGPHAVTSITGTVNGVTNPTYTFDANGNMTAGAGRSVTWTSFNMAASIVEGSTTIALTYDSEHNRVVQTEPSGTTTYLNDPASGAMEEEFVAGSTTTWRDYLMADGQIVALRSNTGGTVTPLYFNGDHLGSASVLTSASGAVTERDSYDAWGRRRNPNGTDNASCSITSATTRGFTGQEMMDAVCEINLNARIYDPTIGRMFTADPMVPNPLNGQSYNRYSYVNNRPLSLTDPSGYYDYGAFSGKSASISHRR